MNKLLKEKFKEAVRAVLPLTIVIIAVLAIFENDNKINDIIMFSIGSFLLMVGLVVFNIGAVHSMMDISKEIGLYITKKKKIWLIVLVGVIIGLLITISEPSVWVLGKQFEVFVDKYLMIFSISIGVAVFLVIALLRLIFNIRLNVILLISLGALFALAVASEFLGAGNFVPVAFDSGGVTTGPMAVPFIISLGLGVLSSAQSKKNNDESFGMVGIASIGPIMAVLVLGLVFKGISPPAETEVGSALGLVDSFLLYLKDMGIAILPFVFFFIVFQLLTRRFSKEKIIKIMIGFLMTYFGLVLFLVGASVGFMNIGKHLGETIASFDQQWLLVVFGIIFGFVIVAAEPSVVVLVGQVQEVTNEGVSKKVMLMAMSIGVSLAVGLAMLRIVYDISIWFFIVPGYLIAIILSFIVPKLFTGIAFDSGGAVSGALTSTFLVPFALGSANIIYPGSTDKLLSNAFGLVAFVAMAPLITIQIVGLIFKVKQKAIMERDIKGVPIDTEDEIIDLDSLKASSSYEKTSHEGQSEEIKEGYYDGLDGEDVGLDVEVTSIEKLPNDPDDQSISLGADPKKNTHEQPDGLDGENIGLDVEVINMEKLPNDPDDQSISLGADPQKNTHEQPDGLDGKNIGLDVEVINMEKLPNDPDNQSISLGTDPQNTHKQPDGLDGGDVGLAGPISVVDQPHDDLNDLGVGLDAGSKSIHEQPDALNDRGIGLDADLKSMGEQPNGLDVGNRGEETNS